MDDLFDLSGKVILLAGAGGGLGAPIARALAVRGASIAALDRDLAALEVLADSHKGISAVQGDITSSAEIAAAFTQAESEFGSVDALINAAGVLPVAPADELDETDFRTCMELNVTAAFLLSQQAIHHMSGRGGRIVHISSVSSQVANPNYVAYATSKAGLSHMVRVLGRELAPKGICVNAIGPAIVETPLNAPYLADPGFRARALADIPMGRFGSTDDLIAPIVLLLAPGGAFITGQTIYVDGGRTLV